MSTAVAERTKQEPSAPKAFRLIVAKIATELLTDWVGEERAASAIGRVTVAVASAAATAKKPEEFYSCTPASIANCVATAALTNIMPGSGPVALAYLIPRSPRKGEQKQLQYQLSHRGLNALAARSNQTMIPIPISHRDKISVSPDGEAIVESLDFDDPPGTLDELRGIVVVVKRLDTGVVITRGWVPKKTLLARRESSDSYSFAMRTGNEWAKDSDPWHQYPIEMAMKAAMHYASSRGWCVIDDSSAIRAMASDVVEAVSVRASEGPALPAVAAASQLDVLTAQINGPSLDEPEETPSTPPTNPNALAWEVYATKMRGCSLLKEVRETYDEFFGPTAMTQWTPAQNTAGYQLRDEAERKLREQLAERKK